MYILLFLLVLVSSVGASDLDSDETLSYLPPRNEIEPIGALSRVDTRLANEYYREISPFSFDPPRLFYMPRRAEAVSTFLTKFDGEGSPKGDINFDVKAQFQALITAHPSDSQLRKKYAGYLNYLDKTIILTYAEMISRMAHLARNHLLFSGVERDDETFIDQFCYELNDIEGGHPFEEVRLDDIHVINQAHLTGISIHEVARHHLKVLMPIKKLLSLKAEGLVAEDMEGLFDAVFHNLLTMTPPPLKADLEECLFNPKGDYFKYLPITPLTQSYTAKWYLERREYERASRVYETYLPRFTCVKNEPLSVDAYGLRAYHMFPSMSKDYNNLSYAYYMLGLYEMSHQASTLSLGYAQTIAPRYMNAIALVALERYREAKALLRGLRALPKETFKAYPEMHSTIKKSYEHVLTALDTESEQQGRREWKEHMSQRHQKVLGRLQQKMQEKLASMNAISDEEARKKADAVAAMLLQEEETETQSHRRHPLERPLC